MDCLLCWIWYIVMMVLLIGNPIIAFILFRALRDPHA